MGGDLFEMGYQPVTKWYAPASSVYMYICIL